jgi:hypothetical protein
VRPRELVAELLGIVRLKGGRQHLNDRDSCGRQSHQYSADHFIP